MRRQVRLVLQDHGNLPYGSDYEWASDFIEAARAVGQSLVATIGHAFPIFLTPRPGLRLDELPASQPVRIRFSAAPGDSPWVIATTDEETLFTFDLPEQLFALYADEGVLSRRQAAELKASYLGEFTAIYAPTDHIKVFNFRLVTKNG